MKKILFILPILVLTSCTWQDTVYHHYHTLPSKGWEHCDTIMFTDTLLTDTLNHHVYPFGQKNLQLDLCLRHYDNYPYKNLQLAIIIEWNHLHQEDVVAFNLTDEKGRWRGQGWGAHYSIQQTIKLLPPPSFNLENKSPFCIYILPLMQDSILKGIDNVGIHIKAL